jgi:hypothetical protein
MQPLACSAVAIFASKRLVPAQLVFHLSAMTATTPFYLELLSALTNAIWRAVFPFLVYSAIISSAVFVPLRVIICHFYNGIFVIPV